MGLFNRVYAKLLCPRCGKESEMEIECRFGDVRQMHEYKIGDKYQWLHRKAVQIGGRPDNGNFDGEGYAECPLCRKDFFVDVVVRNDVIQRIEPNNAKTSYIH